MKSLDWKSLLQSQQKDLIERFNAFLLLNSSIEGYQSEFTEISVGHPSYLKARKFAWDMVDKYNNQDSKIVFLNSLKGILAETSVKMRLGDLVGNPNYNVLPIGDGSVDLRLTKNPKIGIQIKSRCYFNNIYQTKWYFSQKEIERNIAIICVLFLEEITDYQHSYKLALTGFLPTEMIKNSSKNSYAICIEDLLYIGGLYNFIENFSDNSEDSDYELKEVNRVQAELYYEEALEESKVEEIKLRQWLNYTEEQLTELEKIDIYWKTPFVEWIESNKNLSFSIYQLLNDEKIFKRFWDVYLDRVFELKLATSYTEKEVVIKEYDLRAQSLMNSLSEEGYGCCWNSYQKEQ